MSLSDLTRVLRGCLLVVAALLAPLVLAGAAGAETAPWPTAGQDLSNTRSSPQTALSRSNAGSLKLKWTYTTHGDVSATAAVVGGAAYFPDWGGYIHKVDAKTGAAIWSRKLSDYPGEPANARSRTGPAVVDGVVYIGDQNGGHLLALDARTGDLMWSTKINPHPFAIITQSPMVHGGVVYVGAASLEEAVAANPAYPCCTFRGSFSAVNARTGQILWTRFVIPDNGGVPGGYSGNAVWGSTPAIDPKTGTVFITTGNNYDVPTAVKDCQAGGGTPAQCLDPENHVDAFMALDMSTGAIKWATGVQGFDAWNVACIPGLDPHNCPNDPGPEGPDFDFGSGPNLFTVNAAGGKKRQLVGAGQKSGTYWALDAATGEIVWSISPAPGSTLGGIQWGSATDGKRIYIAESNFFGIPYQTPGGQTLTSGSFAALDPATGHILWQVGDPRGANDLGPMTTSNGVVLAPSMSGHMYALDAATGAFLWEHEGDGAAIAGASLDDAGTVFWGNGYANLGIPGWDPSTTFYAFSPK
jgi:polyvinyl alcohol dehydrogenase (cytochrome)